MRSPKLSSRRLTFTYAMASPSASTKHLLADDRHDEPHDRQRDEPRPAEPHELVVAETRERPADPDEDEEQRHHLGREDSDLQRALEDGRARKRMLESVERP